MDKLQAAILRVVDGLWETFEWVPITEIERRLPFNRLKIKAAIRKLEKKGLLSWKKRSFLGEIPAVKITERGIEHLAMRDYELHGVFDRVGPVIGEGKEALVRIAWKDEKPLVIKIHRFYAAEFKRIRNSLAYTAIEWWGMKIGRIDRPINFARAKAQIEYNTLERLYGKVSVPKPIAINRTTLVMEFIGDKVPAPNLTQVLVDEELAERTLEEYSKAIRIGFVHGDFNQFNVLVHDGEPVIIDWPQAVPLQYPGAQELLKRDVKNILTFFQRVLRGFSPKSSFPFL